MIRATICPKRCHRTRRGMRGLHLKVGSDYLWHLSVEEARILVLDIRLALDNLARAESRDIRRRGKTRVK